MNKFFNNQTISTIIGLILSGLVAFFIGLNGLKSTVAQNCSDILELKAHASSLDSRVDSTKSLCDDRNNKSTGCFSSIDAKLEVILKNENVVFKDGVTK